ncbi:hypothetical protein B7463_g8291, partial [Scytalidium lignicola]
MPMALFVANLRPAKRGSLGSQSSGDESAPSPIIDAYSQLLAVAGRERILKNDAEKRGVLQIILEAWIQDESRVELRRHYGALSSVKREIEKYQMASRKAPLRGPQKGLLEAIRADECRVISVISVGSGTPTAAPKRTFSSPLWLAQVEVDDAATTAFIQAPTRVVSDLGDA